jgi:hypothetical protein
MLTKCKALLSGRPHLSAHSSCLTVRAGHGPAAEAGQEAPPVLMGVPVVAVRVPAVAVRVPAVLVRVPAVLAGVFPLVVGGTAAVLLEVAVPRQTERAALPSVGGPLAADQA